MSKSHTISSKFTKKEYDWINNFRRFNKIKNNNQLVHIALENLMEVRLADAKQNPPKLPSEYTTAYKYHQQLLNEFAKNPISKKRIDKIFNQWKTKFFVAWTVKENKKLPRSNLMLDSFDDERKIGRPKNPKQSPGRKREKGYEDD